MKLDRVRVNRNRPDCRGLWTNLAQTPAVASVWPLQTPHRTGHWLDAVQAIPLVLAVKRLHGAVQTPVHLRLGTLLEVVIGIFGIFSLVFMGGLHDSR